MNRTVSALNFISIFVVCSGTVSAHHMRRVDFEFAGVVTSVAPELATEFVVGEELKGEFTVDVEDGSIFGRGFTATIGGDYFLRGGMKLRVSPSPGPINLDAFPIGGPLVDGHEPEYFSLNFPNNRFSVFTGFPDGTFPTAGDRSGLRFDGNDSWTVDFQIHRFEVVPEPTGTHLGLLGLLLTLVGSKFLSRRNARRRIW